MRDVRRHRRVGCYRHRGGQVGRRKVSTQSGELTQLLFSNFIPPRSPDSLADLSELNVGRSGRHNGGHGADAEEEEARRKGSQGGGSTAGPSGGRQEGGERSQHKAQVRVALLRRADSLILFTCLYFV